MEQHQACAQCTKTCALFHGKRKPSSFFKIMLGDDFSRVLYLPPKFGRTMSDLVDKKITLTDSSGRDWDATVSKFGSSLALDEGWNEFSLDHGLEVGDFLVFYYVKESHFYVQIFDRSGCDRREFSKKRNKNKRSRDISGSSDRDAMLNASVVPEPDAPKMDWQNGEADVGGTQSNVENISKHDKSNGSAQSLCREENCEDPRHMTSQDNCGVNGTGKITARDSKVSHVDHGYRVHQNDATPCICPLFKFKGTPTSNASEVELSGKNNTLGDTDRSAYNKTSTLKLEENRKNNFTKSNGDLQECQFDEGLESGKNNTLGDTDRSAHNKTSTLKLKENRRNNFTKSNGDLQECQFDKGLESGKNNTLGDTDRSAYSKTSTLKLEENRKNNFKSNGDLQGCQFDKDLESGKNNTPGDADRSAYNNTSTVGMTRQGTSFKGKLSPEGEMSKRIKKEPHVDMSPSVPSSNYEFGATGSSKVIKRELGQSPDIIDQDDDDDDDDDNDDHDHDIQTSASVSCTVPMDNDHFLELPACLPYSRRGRVRMERMMVFLRNPMDPKRNLWPVLYHVHSRFKILTTGWSQFRRASNIQPADVCTFRLEDESERIFSVDIVHN